MKKKLFFAAVAIVALASCSDNEFIGDNSPTTQQENAADEIQFSFDMQKVTRGDIYGNAAATLLGNNFYVTGTKGTEAEKYPTSTLVFDNYLVHYSANTAGTTESNTANWEYVGVTPGESPYGDYIKLSSLKRQTIKYWDYSTAQYDFLAFSTGEYKPVLATIDGSSNVTSAANESNKTIGVTAMKYGSDLNASGVAYAFDLPSINALKNTYISDITEVVKANYGKEVQLKFKNLGSKVRVALYETVPGYSVKAASVKFYTVDNDAVKSGQTGYEAPTTAAALISENTSSFASTGTIKVYFPNVGTTNESNKNYDKAAATVKAGSGDTKKTFGTLATDKYAAAEFEEESGSNYLGRTLPYATFAGDKNAAYYETVFPVTTGYPLTLRVDYTLISTDGSGETINVYGAKAVVPSTYTVWQPNYAYTYVFKISDNTNGWTDQDKTLPGLFPITFDAVVTEATDASGEQTTITTVATPTITTYQQGHNAKMNGEFDVVDEYDNDGAKLYVQVMDNNVSPAVLVGASGSSLYKLNTQTLDATSTDRSLLYAVTGTKISEASVMDALENQWAVDGSTKAITGRNSIVLTPNSNIQSGVTEILNGVDDNKITVAAGEAAEIAIANLSEGTYAYVYDYSNAAKVLTDIYQPITPGATIGANGKCYVTTTTLGSWDDGTTAHYSTAGAPDKTMLYFSITTNGGANKTYSFVSVDGKDAIPAGLLAYPVSSLTAVADNTAVPASNTFYFDKYTRNTGKYAVKVIKVVD